MIAQRDFVHPLPLIMIKLIGYKMIDEQFVMVPQKQIVHTHVVSTFLMFYLKK